MSRKQVVLAIAGGLAVAAVVVVGWRRTHVDNGPRPIDAPPVHVRASLPARLVNEPYMFPIAVSHSGRYLVDQRGAPFLIVGDSPQALIGNLSVAEAATYVENRRRAGFNALWVNLLCAKYTGCRDGGATFDGIQPFTKPGDLSTPNPAYFARVDQIVRLAAEARIAIFLDPIETGGWLTVLRENGMAKARAYGRFLGRRYRSFRNIVWMSGNDFQTWKNRRDDELVLAVARGIRAEDRGHPHTIELNYLESGSLDDRRWRSTVQLDAAYTYHPTYARVLREYNRRSFKPVFMVEAGYEYEQNNSSISRGDPPTLRRQEYWTMLSGAAGQFYGNHYTWQFADGWEDHIDTVGSAQFGYLVKLFSGLPWFRLVPDQSHKIVTAGFGSFSTSGDVDSSDYVTTAATPDGRVAVSYLPDGGTISLAASRLAPGARARWFDPTRGRYAAERWTPLPRGRSISLSAPDRNADGDHDWVLVIAAPKTVG